MMAPEPPLRNSCSPSLSDTVGGGGSCTLGVAAERPARSEGCLRDVRGGARKGADAGGSSRSLGTVMSKGSRAALDERSSRVRLTSSDSTKPSPLRAPPDAEAAVSCVVVRADDRVFRRRSSARVASAISPSDDVLSAAGRSRTRSSVRSRSLCRPVPPPLVVAKRLASSSITAFSKTHPRET